MQHHTIHVFRAKARIAFAKASTLIIVGTIALPAFADLPGQAMPPVVLQSTEGDVFTFQANKAYTAQPGSFFGAYYLGAEVLVNNQTYSEVLVTFVSDCINFDKKKFTAHLSCAAVYDADSNQWRAELNTTSCTTSDSPHVTTFNFGGTRLPNAWYFAGRYGYSSGHSCNAKVAVKVDGNRWLVDPVNGTHDFQPQLDNGWTPQSTFKRP